MNKRLLLFVVFLYTFQISFAQLSTKHYIPPVVTSPNDPPSESYIYISTPKDNVSFTVTPVGNISESYSNIVSNSSPFLYRIVRPGQDPGDINAALDDDGNSQLSAFHNVSNTKTSNKGYIIEASDVIYVSVRFRSNSTYQAGALVSKGSSALGTEFRVGAFKKSGNSTPSGFLSFATVMASEDNTNVTFGDFNPNIKIINHTGNSAINTRLNTGETYSIAVSFDDGGNPNDIIGSLITSDKPIAVNTGSITGSFASGSNGRDYGVDQIVGFSKVGSEYIFVKGNGGPTGNDWENILLIAHKDNTEIYVSGNSTPTAVINAGEHHLFEGNYFHNDNLYVQTSEPVFAYQGVGGNPGSSPNQGMFFVPPLSCENKGNINNIAQIHRITPGSDPANNFVGGISIVAETGASIQINNQDISNYSVSGPFTVAGNTNYETYKVSGLSGNISVTSNGELYCAYFNRNSYATSGSFYSGFPSPPEINFNTTVSSLGNCMPNVTLLAQNTDNFDAFSWYKFDGTNFIEIIGSNDQPSYVPTEPGQYKLVGTISCSGAIFESTIIPVSVCPDDYDNDLIIDNIDLDLDNDGILNCEESLGNGIIDYTDLNNLTINLSSGNISSFITSSISANNATLTGLNNGIFTSELIASATSEQTFKLDFNEPSNIEYTIEDITNHNIVNGESFVIKIGPLSKNLTLIDPDNQLLIDTNYDDIYEENVDFYSTSEIRYRINPSPKGNTPFKIVAHHIDEITFEHYSVSLTDNSSLTSKLILTCFQKDSDNDGIEDALDLDSDNDGIPDIVEFTGTHNNPVFEDNNQDGVDDHLATLTNLDSDNDGVFNYIDLDSDNDGVFDLYEANHGLNDTNLDGVIDSSIPGSNGLDDRLETADNGVLTYTIADFDSDFIHNFIDLDSDGDNCYDVTDAGFTDLDSDGLLGSSPVQIDTNGLVINITDGYTIPNTNYFTNGLIEYLSPFEDVAYCELSDGVITIDTNADNFQWQISTDNGVNWNDITDNTKYSGSLTNSLLISNFQNSENGYQFRVQLNKNGNSCGLVSNVVSLTVEPLPTVASEVTLQQCDDDTDGFSSFNLNEATSLISSNYVNETFKFYESETDALNNTSNTISDPFNYSNSIQNEVWAVTTSSFGCNIVSKINLQVSTTQIPLGFHVNLTECDDFLDANGNNTVNNNDQDGITSFDLTNVNQQVLNFFPPTQQLTISYYRNETDALAELNPILDITNFRNNPGELTVFIRVDSDVNNACLGLGEHISLQIDSVPDALPTSTGLDLCDNFDDGDGANGIVQNFDLSSKSLEILNGQDPSNFTLTYHETASDANTGLNPIINISSYENKSNPQTIYTRVTNNTTGCFNDHVSFNLSVNPIPIANFVNDLEVCDDDLDGSAQNGFSQSFNLEAQTAIILGTQDPATHIVTYHSSLQDAETGTLPLVSPFSNAVQNEQLIWVRIVNTLSGCTNTISNFKVIVNPSPIANHVSNLTYCDNDSDGNDTSGVITNIDLDSTIPIILGSSQSIGDFNVTFHETFIDAEVGSNTLTTPYTNTTPYNQTIYVRVENKDTGCVTFDTTFEVIINELPSFDVSTPQIVCLNGPPTILTVDNPSDIYDYYWTDSSGNITNGINLSVTSGGTYEVTAITTDGTNCERTKTIRVNESIIATLTPDDITVIDDSVNNSISIDPTNIGIGNYEYALVDSNGNIVYNYQDSPLFENLKGDVYTLLVNDKNGCGETSYEVSVLEFPKFFTPNNDGINDTWFVKGLNSRLYSSIQVNIFNRFGKLIATYSNINEGWDGVYGNKTLHSDDYWFHIIIHDFNGNTRTRTGNFSLLRK